MPMLSCLINFFIDYAAKMAGSNLVYGDVNSSLVGSLCPDGKRQIRVTAGRFHCANNNRSPLRRIGCPNLQLAGLIRATRHLDLS